jgi:putative PIN family toxin of toxin-antitoxin system
MLRAVIDTNLFVRGLLKGPVTMPLILAWKEERFQLVTSEKLLAELFEVLARPKFSRYFTGDDVRELGELIYERAEVVDPSAHVTLCRDPKDNIFLDVAIAGKVAPTPHFCTARLVRMRALFTITCYDWGGTR